MDRSITVSELGKDPELMIERMIILEEGDIDEVFNQEGIEQTLRDMDFDDYPNPNEEELKALLINTINGMDDIYDEDEEITPKKLAKRIYNFFLNETEGKLPYSNKNLLRFLLFKSIDPDKDVEYSDAMGKESARRFEELADGWRDLEYDTDDEDEDEDEDEEDEEEELIEEVEKNYDDQIKDSDAKRFDDADEDEVYKFITEKFYKYLGWDGKGKLTPQNKYKIMSDVEDRPQNDELDMNRKEKRQYLILEADRALDKANDDADKKFGNIFKKLFKVSKDYEGKIKKVSKQLGGEDDGVGGEPVYDYMTEKFYEELGWDGKGYVGGFGGSPHLRTLEKVNKEGKLMDKVEKAFEKTKKTAEKKFNK